MEVNKQDVLVIGSGIAGLTFALKCANRHPEMLITIITKSVDDECNTKYAQGGIAVVMGETDDYEKHIQDTLVAGDGLCDEAVVRFVIESSRDSLNELIEWGARFDKNEAGEYDLGREGGHTENRVLHHKDVTGVEIERALLAQIEATKNITFLKGRYAVDLITNHHQLVAYHQTTVANGCYGAYVMEPNGKIIRYLANTTLIASGGSGQVYRATTNPAIATGDGIAMAFRAGAKIKNMEFVQFHPTALYEPGKSPAFLISEAVRGFGAKLCLKNGDPFMHKYDQREELASRDIVARAIDAELKLSGDDYVMLDCRHLDPGKFWLHFPNIFDACQLRGINLNKDLIPIVPAAHYQCGGIDTYLDGTTSLPGLLACGECTNTGLHGANRLASNSLLEALVYADSCFFTVSRRYIKTQDDRFPEFPEWDAQGTSSPKDQVQIMFNRKELQSIMTDLVGIVRSDERLKLARKKLDNIQVEVTELYNTKILSPALCELRNLANIAHLIVDASIKRKENRGGYFNVDRIKTKEK